MGISSVSSEWRSPEPKNVEKSSYHERDCSGFLQKWVERYQRTLARYLSVAFFVGVAYRLRGSSAVTVGTCNMLLRDVCEGLRGGPQADGRPSVSRAMACIRCPREEVTTRSLKRENAANDAGAWTWLRKERARVRERGAAGWEREREREGGGGGGGRT